MVKVAVVGGQVRLKLMGLDRLLAFAEGLEFPLVSVRAVYADPQPDYRYPWWQGVRAPGSSVPGLVRAGTFRWGGYREFWCDYFRGNAVAFELGGEPYDRVVVAVRDPEAVVQAVRGALEREA